MSPRQDQSQLSRRRQFMAGLGTAGLAAVPLHGPLSGVIRAAESAANVAKCGRQCLFIFLFGGPSHIDLFDMKPKAPQEIRGEFQPIATSVPGIEVSEHLPRMARAMEHFCLLRSMTHQMPVHGPACSEIYSGRPYFGPPITDQATPEDWPSLAACVQRFFPQVGRTPNSVVLPWYTQFVGQDRKIAGQTGGRMGESFNPFLVQGDPTQDQFDVPGLLLPKDTSDARWALRRELVSQLDTWPVRGEAASRPSLDRLAENYAAAFRIVGHADLAAAFQLGKEPPESRDRYGRNRFGQSLLLARRLTAAGVPLVSVNWDDDNQDDKVSPHWDTHTQNFPKLKDRLAPPFDQAMSALVSDLAERGQLERTLVVAVGEFGRTPKVGVVNQNAMTDSSGRDHWPHAFTAVLAGGPVRGGQVYGSTTDNGGYVKDRPVSPADLTATVLNWLGVDPETEYDDRFLKIRQKLSEGRVLDDLGGAV